jgi:Na+:H+ antiporter
VAAGVAVAIAVRGRDFTRRQIALLIVALPRGLAAGVLSTLPAGFDLPNTAALSGAVFATIVTTILLFSLGLALASRLPDER